VGRIAIAFIAAPGDVVIARCCLLAHGAFHQWATAGGPDQHHGTMPDRGGGDWNIRGSLGAIPDVHVPIMAIAASLGVWLFMCSTIGQDWSSGLSFKGISASSLLQCAADRIQQHHRDSR